MSILVTLCKGAEGIPKWRKRFTFLRERGKRMPSVHPASDLGIFLEPKRLGLSILVTSCRGARRISKCSKRFSFLRAKGKRPPPMHPASDLRVS